MESDNSPYTASVRDLQLDSRTSSELGLGKELAYSPLNRRNKKMVAENKKSGTKRGLKAVEKDTETEDDEPIGSLFKLKRHRNSNKTRARSEGIRKINQKAEVVEKNLPIRDEDFGGMNDTLANFRKRLKGKKVVESDALRRGVSIINASLELEATFHVKSASNSVEKNNHVDDGEALDSLDKQSDRKAEVVGKGKKNEELFTNSERLIDEAKCMASSNVLIHVQNNEDGSHENDSVGSSRFVNAELMPNPFQSDNQEKEDNVEFMECLCSDLNDSNATSKKTRVLTESLKPVEPSYTGDVARHQHDRVEKCCYVSSPKVLAEIHHNLGIEAHKVSLGAVLPESYAKPGNDISDQLREAEWNNRYKISNADGPISVLIDSLKKEVQHCDCEVQANFKDRFLKEGAGSCKLCGLTSYQSQNNEVTAMETDSLNHEDLPLNDEATAASSMSVNPGDIENWPDDVGSLQDSEMQECKSSSIQRVVRTARKHRLQDMAYEGDADWEILVNEESFLESQSDKPFKVRENYDLSSDVLNDGDIGGAAAVAVGLKARSLSSIEKIKFKEILKRKGGIQEYLDVRNFVLSLWRKNVSRILSLTDCGVSDEPPKCESSRSSLIREVYMFLDQRGFINVGIASKDEEPAAKDNDEKVICLMDRIDDVASKLDNVNTLKSSVEDQDGVIGQEEKQRLQNMKGNILYHPLSIEAGDSGALDAQTFGDSERGGRIHVSEKLSMKPAKCDFVMADDQFQCNSEDGKKILVIGAGPAGLTAARHLQRQGFSVTVLEARNRIGGRVHTDHCSLSVPVDLGASIITGIEADVASERMPDPSSLICSQLGLELKVLHGFCPLYDIVTGEKVPSDMDDALQAEFNSLIDCIDLLVEQVGKEEANKMSLEDGLEYGLRRSRISHKTMDGGKSEGRNHSRFVHVDSPEADILSPLERRVMNWHYAHTEYGCAAYLKEVSLPNWNQDEYYGGFGGAHAMVKGGYSAVVDSLGEGLNILLNHVVTEVSYSSNADNHGNQHNVKVCTSDGSEFFGDSVLITLPLGCLKAGTVKFSPPLPDWKYSSIERLGFGVLNKVILEFPEVFWDDSLDYFGATAEETDKRGRCFMFWNVRKTVGAPVLIALVVGKAVFSSQLDMSEHVDHAVKVLRKLFGETSVPDPVATVVTDWGNDPYCYGAYSYVAIGASGEDYDALGRSVDNCLFFAGEATCKEHPDTVGGAMITGLREAVRMIDIFRTGTDCSTEIEAMEASQKKPVSDKDEVRDIIKRLEMVELSNVLTRQTLIRNMFFTTKSTVGRLHLAKELLKLPVEILKSFAGTKQGLSTLNSWMLDSMGKNGTQLLRHCVHILVRVSTNLLAVRLSGIGRTVKEKVCMHTSRDIRGIASQLVKVWLELFRKEKASGQLKALRQSSTANINKRSFKNRASEKSPMHDAFTDSENRDRLHMSDSAGNQFAFGPKFKEGSENMEVLQSSVDVQHSQLALSEEEKAAIAAAEAARAVAEAAAKTYAIAEARSNASLPLPVIPSFTKFARGEQHIYTDEFYLRKRNSSGFIAQFGTSEIGSRNSKVRDWSADFTAACLNADSSRISMDDFTQENHSNEMVNNVEDRELFGDSVVGDSSILTKAWIDSAGSDGIKDYRAIDRWQSQAAAADPDFFRRTLHIKDEEASNTSSGLPTRKHHGRPNESSLSQVTVNKEPHRKHPQGADRIKHAVMEYVASLLMPLYRGRKVDRDGYKSIMKKTAVKVMEHTTDAEKTMHVSKFLDAKRKNKIRVLVDKLIERHAATSKAPET